MKNVFSTLRLLKIFLYPLSMFIQNIQGKMLMMYKTGFIEIRYIFIILPTSFSSCMQQRVQLHYEILNSSGISDDVQEYSGLWKCMIDFFRIQKGFIKENL